MSFFSNFFKLSHPIAGNVNTLGDDVRNTKTALKRLGHFSGSINPWPDRPMLDSLKNFQQSAGLDVDGVMKPGGPTERGLNKALGDTGIGNKLFLGIVADKTQDRNEDIRIWPGRDRDNNRIRTPPIVAKPKKQEPWFHSSKLPPIKGEALSSNERTLFALLKSSANGNLPMYQADALSSGKDSAIGEYGDFLRQMHKRAPERIKDFEKEVMERLPDDAKTKLATYLNRPSTSKPSMRSLLTGDGGEDLSNTAANPKKQTSQATTPSYQSPIDKDYRDAIADKESKGEPNNGYGARNSQGYLGRYQMSEDALIDGGMKTKDGKWTGKHGVQNGQDFLNNPQAQEHAFAEYMLKNEGYLKSNGSLKSIGKTFSGKKGEGIRITKAGLLAAAHRRGHIAVRDYLKFQKENGWSSDFSKEPVEEKRPIHEQVETRLRLFQNKDY